MAGLGLRSSLSLAVTVLASGCTTWTPLALVASDRPLRDVVLTGHPVEAQACGTYVFGFVVSDTKGTMNEVMDGLHEAAPQAIGFQNLRLDLSSSWYAIYIERCIHASAEPVLPVPTIPRDGRPVPPRRPPPASPPPTPDDQLEQELLAPPPPPAPPG